MKLKQKTKINAKIKLENIFLSYNNKKTYVLKDISFSVFSWEVLSIIWVNWSGKSTLLSILSTLLKPTSGDIVYENMNYKDIKNIDDFRKNNIGFIFQFHYLINYLSVKENINLANEKASKEEIFDLLKLLGIQNLIDKYPNEISGGQRQRVAIARALINNPKIIFADEPTGNLDSKNSLNVFELFKTLANIGTTIIVATHDKSLALLANKIYEVKDGKIE